MDNGPRRLPPPSARAVPRPVTGGIGLPDKYACNSLDPSILIIKEYINHMIHPYDNSTQTRWDLGEFKVQLNQPNNPRPIGFCDGSPEDVTELLSIAEAEGVDDVEIHKKILKTGREIWTLGGQGNPSIQ